MKTFPQSIIGLYAECVVMTERTFPFAPRTNANAMVLDENLGDGMRHHATSLLHYGGWYRADITQGFQIMVR
jgi:hypothetical protein